MVERGWAMIENITQRNLLIAEGNRIVLGGVGLYLAPDEWLRFCEEVLLEDLPIRQEEVIRKLAEKIRPLASRYFVL